MYESYDLPADHAANATGELPTVDELVLEHRGFIVADFAEVYAIRLHRTGDADMTWAEFDDLLRQLLATPHARLFRHYAPKPGDRERPDPKDDDFGGGDDL